MKTGVFESYHWKLTKKTIIRVLIFIYIFIFISIAAPNLANG